MYEAVRARHHAQPTDSMEFWGMTEKVALRRSTHFFQVGKGHIRPHRPPIGNIGLFFAAPRVGDLVRTITLPPLLATCLPISLGITSMLSLATRAWREDRRTQPAPSSPEERPRALRVVRPPETFAHKKGAEHGAPKAPIG